MKKTTEIEISVAIGTILLFVASILFRDQIGNWIEKETAVYGVIIILSAAFLLEFLPQYLSPHILILQSMILGIPIMKVTIIVLIGAALGSIVGYEFGKEFGARVVRNLTKPKDYESIRKKAKKHGIWVLVLIGLTPLPYIPLVLGSIGIERKIFIFFGIIPRLIGIALFAALMYFV